jgi:hypothetical protein
LSARLDLEGFEYEMEMREDGFAVIVKRCPWHDIMEKSGRGNLSDKVSELICRVENSVWASEFRAAEGEGKPGEGEGREIGFEREERICRGEGRCVLRFCK